MKKLNIKQPKYILPLVLLPFLFIIGYAISTFSNDKDENNGLVSKDELNVELQEASTGKTDSKIEALKKRYKRESDFTGIQNVEAENDPMTENSGSLYATEEMIYIDSINQVSKLQEEKIKEMTKRYVSKDYTTSNDSITNEQSTTNKNSRTTQKQKQDSTPSQIYQAAYQREYDKIQKQLRSVDSMRNATRQQGTLQTTQVQDQQWAEYDNTTNGNSKENQNGKTSLVHKKNTQSAFNTLSSNNDGEGIDAMLDETVTVQGSSRIRIRLLEDVSIENVILNKGDYLYGIVSGITGQRVNISIKSIMVKGKIYNVDLVVYDNDGMEGFFIPDNYFRQITKEIGASAVSQTNFTFENATETWESLLYKTLNNIIRRFGTTLSNTIRQQKATLKYNTQIYLYNKNEN